MKLWQFALGAGWIVLTVLLAMAMALLVVKGFVNDCSQMGKSRIGKTIIECNVISQ